MFSRSRFLLRRSDESESLSDMMVGLVPPMVICKCRSLSDMVAGCVPSMVRCKCRAFLTWLQDVFLPWSDVSVGKAFLTSLRDVLLPWSNISIEEDEDLDGG